MKLLKLSLAAALTAGALATVASATPLEEAIKNVDLGGSLTLKYHNKGKDKVQSHGWEVTGKFNFKTKFDDNFYAVAGLKIDRNNAYDEDNDGKLYLNNAYLGYTNGGTTLIAGRYTLDTFFTDDLYGNGVKLVNTDVEGLTLAALWADNLNKDPDLVASSISDKITSDYADMMKGKDDATKKALMDERDEKIDLLNDYVSKRDLFGIAAIGSYDPVNFQLWYARLNKIADVYAAQLGFDFDLGNNNKMSLLAQFGGSSLKNDFKNAAKLLGYDNFKNGHLYAVQLGGNFSGVDLNLGYVDYSTSKDAYSFVSLEDKGQYISAGEQTNNNYQLFSGKNNMVFATAMFDIPDSSFNIGLDYVHNTNKMNDEKTKSNELVGRLGYNYSKKLKFTSYYSNYKETHEKASNKFMFKVKYSF